MKTLVLVLICYFVGSFIMFGVFDYIYVKKIDTPFKFKFECIEEIFLYSMAWPIILIAIVIMLPYVLIDWIIKRRV